MGDMFGNFPQSAFFKINEFQSTPQSQKKPTVTNDPNFNFCMPPCLPYAYNFYRLPSQFSCRGDSPIPLALQNSLQPNEEQKEPLPCLFRGQELPLLPCSQPMVSTFRDDKGKDFFKIEVNKEYYIELYGKKG